MIKSPIPVQSSMMTLRWDFCPVLSVKGGYIAVDLPDKGIIQI
jgi:hypothetical protein